MVGDMFVEELLEEDGVGGAGFWSKSMVRVRPIILVSYRAVNVRY